MPLGEGSLRGQVGSRSLCVNTCVHVYVYVSGGGVLERLWADIDSMCTAVCVLVCMSWVGVSVRVWERGRGWEGYYVSVRVEMGENVQESVSACLLARG